MVTQRLVWEIEDNLNFKDEINSLKRNEYAICVFRVQMHTLLCNDFFDTDTLSNLINK